jgi:hypothetical protein
MATTGLGETRGAIPLDLCLFRHFQPNQPPPSSTKANSPIKYSPAFDFLIGVVVVATGALAAVTVKDRSLATGDVCLVIGSVTLAST